MASNGGPILKTEFAFPNAHKINQIKQDKTKQFSTESNLLLWLVFWQF